MALLPNSNEVTLSGTLVACAAIVPAAGLSRRLGRPKQLVEFRGRIFLARVIENILHTPLEPVVVVLGHQAETIKEILSGPRGLGQWPVRVRLVVNPEYCIGQASSIRAGLAVLSAECDGAVFWMGDQIGVRPETVRAILDRAAGPDRPGIVRPRYGGAPGGPVYWHRRLFPRLMELEGDAGGRELISELREDLVWLDRPADEAPLDLDTEADLDRIGERLSIV